jgi:hypothetical protein
MLEGRGGGSGHDVRRNFKGAFSCNKANEEVIADMIANFGNYANYIGGFGPLGMGSAAISFSGTIAAGNTLMIDAQISPNFGLSSSYTVSVTNATNTGFSFSANPGHVLHPATINFAISEDPDTGLTTFEISVEARFANTAMGVLFNLGGSDLESRIWNNVVSNVQRECRN